VVEHPELVAERLTRLPRLVGNENVIANTDCRFAQGPFGRRVHPSMMWAKLRALSEGAAIASRTLAASVCLTPHHRRAANNTTQTGVRPPRWLLLRGIGQARCGCV
jgi:hypothetical protein